MARVGDRAAGAVGMRPGHHRPLGTTTSMRFPDWGADNQPPQLGDVAWEQSGDGIDNADRVLRAYTVVGVLEGRKPGAYRLIMERVAWETMPPDGRRVWTFWKLPRR